MKESDYTQTDDPSRFLDLKDGDIFDLGGVHLDIFSCAGHTPGSVTVLVREERTLIVGDACSNFTFLAGEESLPVALYEKNLRAMKRKTDGKYGRVLEAHGTGELPPTLLKVCFAFAMRFNAAARMTSQTGSRVTAGYWLKCGCRIARQGQTAKVGIFFIGKG